MKNPPKKGWHEVYCAQCHRPLGTVTHFGGKRKLKKCTWCKADGSICFECFKLHIWPIK